MTDLKPIIESYLDQKLIESLGHVPQICEQCGKCDPHQPIWCSRCPGKTVTYPDMTWRTFVERSGQAAKNALAWYIVYQHGGSDPLEWGRINKINTQIDKTLRSD